jgi:hypothetical protein
VFDVLFEDLRVLVVQDLVIACNKNIIIITMI